MFRLYRIKKTENILEKVFLHFNLISLSSCIAFLLHIRILNYLQLHVFKFFNCIFLMLLYAYRYKITADEHNRYFTERKQDCFTIFNFILQETRTIFTSTTFGELLLLFKFDDFGPSITKNIKISQRSTCRDQLCGILFKRYNRSPSLMNKFYLTS